MQYLQMYSYLPPCHPEQSEGPPYVRAFATASRSLASLQDDEGVMCILNFFYAARLKMVFNLWIGVGH